MKVNSEKVISQPAFQPVVLSFTIESQDELDMLYGLFNYCPNCDVLVNHGINPKSIREALASISSRKPDFDNKCHDQILHHRFNK